MLWHKCRCGALIPQNINLCSTCAEGRQGQLSRHMEYNMHKRNQKAAAFYICSDWRRTRAAVIQLYDGLDIYAYYVQNRIMTADMVHHITPLEDDWNRRLDMTNLLPLNNTNHGIIEALYNKDNATKQATMKQLYGLIVEHWKAEGGMPKVLTGPY